ncbi:hypothetical protein FXV83_09175 [Bradyrhizobium hipponense]|uniref:Uncharacterized protein n=1 Tax=Bradyrhizobium hipponense TaxID=2605638 RepID=A0A5S4YXB1_9BRAD|nr:hypothetical protein [Bradyrhizobium hipponense]TYO66959.1 hypothetical protein FXV83_09175 [Bradyrhizobium hipponense]
MVFFDGVFNRHPIGIMLAEPFDCGVIGGDAKHPAAYYRVMHVSSYFNAAEDSVALEVVAHLLKALFFLSMMPPTFSTPAELFAWTEEGLRELSKT